MKLMPILLSLLPACAAASEAVVRLSPEQLAAAAMSTAPLSGLRGGGERRLPAQVVVPPAQTAVVTAPLGGVVAGINAAYGDRVKRGQVLARIQGPELLVLQREFAAARAQADVAVEARRRDESLFADGIVSQSRLSTTQAAERQASALVAEKRAGLRLAGMPEPAADGRGFSGAAEIRVPFDAVVLDAPVQPGQRVDAAAVLFKLGRLSPLWLEMQATPAQAAGLAPGDAVGIPGCKVAGKLTVVAPHLNPATQSVLLRAELADADGCVRPFQFVNAHVTPARPTDGATWRVPVGALARHQGQAWLFAEAPGGFRPLPVKVLDETEREAAVAPADAASSALAADTRIVVKGIAAIKGAWLGIGAGEGK